MQYDYSGLILNVASIIRRPAPNPDNPNDPAYKVRTGVGRFAKCLHLHLDDPWLQRRVAFGPYCF